MVFVLLEVDATLCNDVGFKNTCIVSGKWNVSSAIPRLYGLNLLRLPQLLVELLVPDQGYRQSVGSQAVAITVGVQVEDSSSNPMGI